MIIPKIKQFQCIQYDPIELWEPKPESNIHYQLVVFIGPKDDQTSVMFYIDIISGITGFAPRKSLILNEYSWDSVVDQLTEQVRLCAAKSWDEVTTKLREFMVWEYENYKPYVRA